jgi:CRP-like cAMP-binding protein
MINIGFLMKHGAQLRQYSKGQIIFYEGNEAQYFFVIIKGKVKVININDNSKEFIQGIFYNGQSFGEAPLFSDEQKYSATAIADGDVEIARLEKTAFFKILKNNFELHFEITRVLATKVLFKEMLNREISSHTPEHCLIALFHYLKKERKKTGEKFQIDLTRQELANLTGLRVETVIRAVKKLETDGKLKILNRKIYIE